MGSYILQETDYCAAVRPDGQMLIFRFNHGYDKNTYPHSPRWSLACVSDFKGTLDRIGVTCAHLEDGLTQLRGNTTPAEWAQKQIDHLVHPYPLKILRLPDTVKLQEPAFSVWMALPGHFEDEADARRQFAQVLDRFGKKVGDTLRPIDEADLLLALDDFGCSCHNAWPNRPWQYADGLTMPLPKGAAPSLGDRQSLAATPEVVSIKGMPGIVMWSVAGNKDAAPGQEKTWEIGGELQMKQHYWKEVFPGQALHDPHGWQVAVDQIKNRSVLPAHAVILGKPSASAPDHDRAQWVSLFGEDAQTGSLDTVAQQLSGHILGEMLLRSCSVLSVNDQDAPLDEPSDEALDSAEDASPPRA